MNETTASSVLHGTYIYTRPTLQDPTTVNIHRQCEGPAAALGPRYSKLGSVAEENQAPSPQHGATRGLNMEV